MTKTERPPRPARWTRLINSLRRCDSPVKALERRAAGPRSARAPLAISHLPAFTGRSLDRPPVRTANTSSLSRMTELNDVLKRYGLDHSSIAVVGADRRPEEGAWCVMVTTDAHPRYLDIEAAASLAADLRRIGELQLAERLSRAIETARRQMRPKD